MCSTRTDSSRPTVARSRGRSLGGEPPSDVSLTGQGKSCRSFFLETRVRSWRRCRPRYARHFDGRFESSIVLLNASLSSPRSGSRPSPSPRPFRCFASPYIRANGTPVIAGYTASRAPPYSSFGSSVGTPPRTRDCGEFAVSWTGASPPRTATDDSQGARRELDLTPTLPERPLAVRVRSGLLDKRLYLFVDFGPATPRSGRSRRPGRTQPSVCLQAALPPTATAPRRATRFHRAGFGRPGPSFTESSGPQAQSMPEAGPVKTTDRPSSLSSPP